MKDLDVRICGQICQMLNEKTVVEEDFHTLARLLNFKKQHIEMLDQSNNPTLDLLEDWGTEKESTIEKFTELLTQMKRYDVIEILKKRLVFVYVLSILNSAPYVTNRSF